MCTAIAEKATVSGFSKGNPEWIAVDTAYVTYDHPYHLPSEHALNIDFVNTAGGPGTRVAVELTRESAFALLQALQSALERSEGVD
ncbi:MAG: DUF6295 family protein [Dehalococcoidia bacterium]|nr:DUF6295 family protein [Dehalococcoidia bacterium]